MDRISFEKNFYKMTGESFIPKDLAKESAKPKPMQRIHRYGNQEGLVKAMALGSLAAPIVLSKSPIQASSNVPHSYDQNKTDDAKSVGPRTLQTEKLLPKELPEIPKDVKELQEALTKLGFDKAVILPQENMGYHILLNGSLDVFQERLKLPTDSATVGVTVKELPGAQLDCFLPAQYAQTLIKRTQ